MQIASRPTWDETWMNVAMVVAERSLCDRDKVGAVVVSAGNRIVDTGYNGPPRGMPLVGGGCSNWCERGKPKTAYPTLAIDYHDCPALHAEANALMFSDRRLREGGTIYISSGVCGGCAKLIANSGVARVVCDTSHTPEHRNSDDWFAFMKRCGLEVTEMKH